MTARPISPSRVGSGISAKVFDVGVRPLGVGEVAELNAFQDKRKWSSKSTMKVSGRVPRVYYPSIPIVYEDLIAAYPDDPERFGTNGGDSGGALYQGNSIYGVLSGSVRGPDGRNVFGDVAKNRRWISDVMANNTGVTFADMFRAFQGGVGVKVTGDYNPDPSNVPIGSLF
ncbi:trypsin-like serine protease [Corynebacterium bovis]|uniref:trypsin-like serine protease n=1 Tax=Corynebacterium bovis TaxID=36808 RepID=UPI00254FA0AF|nr:trypsin-like serine protease [Corynebacterium bovis]MDK8511326.1 trypsin-like serine protease [Corynebacterium bovis]